ncbi:DUF3320 domain-containing protein [Tautonia rosea]|uniref:DUF3320 domain-containing protein n=1 Tax=Tautonia rosea TaxID=2728037 RepID=UPI001474F881|nr:DUF3320 domain-containing protein [Tautonia rosea]
MSVSPALIAERLDTDRRALLDLSLRNPLLNYRTRRRGLTIVGESPAEIVRILLRDGKRMTFEPALERSEEPVADGEPVEGNGVLELPPIDPTDLTLQTDVPEDQLQDRLLAIDAAARTSVEEMGVNTLFLALGMLNWSEEQNGRKVRAPLILLPVALSRANARDRFRVRFTGEDFGTNLSLAERLRAGFGIELPEIPGADDLDPIAYFDAVDAAVIREKGWTVDRDAVALGFFSFSRLLMYRDLDATRWPEDSGPSGHPVVSGLLGEGIVAAEATIDDDEPLDARLGPLDVRPVLDADGSQMLALVDASQGRNLVIQGPPGTGKSQTIANVIADAVGRGRTVLFVAEKAAALEVVHRRLDAVGLGAACLELHSNRTRKRDVLDDLRRTLQLGRPKVGAAEDDAKVLADLRNRLNTVAEAVNRPIGASGISPHDAAGILLRERAVLGDAVPPPIDVPGMADWSGPEFQAKELLVEQLQARLAAVSGSEAIQAVNWSSRTLWTPSDQSELARLAVAGREATDALEAAAVDLAEALGVAVPTSRARALALAEAVRSPAVGCDPTLFPLDDPSWEERRAELDALLDAGSTLADLHQRFDALVMPEAWDRDLIETRATFNTIGRRWWRWFSGAFRRARFRLATLCRGEPPRSNSETLELVDAVLDAQRARETILEHACLAAHVFGRRWRREASDFAELAEVTRFARRVREDVRVDRLPEGTIAALRDDEAVRRASGLSARVRIALDEHRLALDRLADFAGLNRIDWDEHSFQDVRDQIDLAGHQAERLHALALMNQRAASCREEGLGAVVEAAKSWSEAPRLLATAFRVRWAETLIDRAARERPSLAGFSGDDHETIAERFAAVDVAVLGHNRAWAAAEHWTRLPRRQALAGDLAVLRRELEKKTRHLPLRVLLSQAGRAVQAVKPVFLMSPLSVAAYLEPGQLGFDLVVFDEASQVRPVDAMGALLRGRQAIVVGDDRQLPPTTFFDRLTAGDEGIDEDEERLASASDALESVLGLFLAQGSARRMLRWHYRSRHESLIAVSNREFYDGRLIVFPGPEGDRSARGLVLRHLPETVYDRGGSRTNPEEALAVALAVMDFARAQLAEPDDRRLTLGVAAFSAAQAEAITRRLERLRRDDPSCEEFFAEGGFEPFFVKNLESVQGDERDAMFISVGYGRDADGRVSMNFGPLNGEGGERRLNVLITRARLRCEVFTNLRATDLDRGRSTARGVSSLRTFLHFAERGSFDGMDGTPASSNVQSTFEEVLARAIEEEGYAVARGLGSAESRVDLAVVDRDNPGRYRLGILCDGPSYAAPRSARDRDRIRPAVLRGLGWRLEHAWSADWWHDPSGTLAGLVATIEADPSDPVERPSGPRPASITREELGDDGVDVPAMPPYQVASLDLGPEPVDPMALSSDRLAAWVAEVVRVEGPVHEAEVVRRLADAIGLKRLAGKPKEAIEQAASAPFRDGGGIRRRGAFLWPAELDRPTPRDRSALPTASRRLEWVAPEEVAAAAEQVVADAIRVAPDDLPGAVCRLLGFPRTTDEMRARVALVVDALIESGRLVRHGDRLMIATGTDREDGESKVSDPPSPQ